MVFITFEKCLMLFYLSPETIETVEIFETVFSSISFTKLGTCNIKLKGI